MRKILGLCTFLLFSTLVMAEQDTDYPAKLKTTEVGLTFQLNCEPTAGTGFRKLQENLINSHKELRRLVCENRELLGGTPCPEGENPVPCPNRPGHTFIVKKANPDYNALVSLITTAFTTNSKIEVTYDVTQPVPLEGEVNTIEIK